MYDFGGPGESPGGSGGIRVWEGWGSSGRFPGGVRGENPFQDSFWRRFWCHVGGQVGDPNFTFMLIFFSRGLRGGSGGDFLGRRKSVARYEALGIHFGSIFDVFWQAQGEQKCGFRIGGARIFVF